MNASSSTSHSPTHGPRRSHLPSLADLPPTHFTQQHQHQQQRTPALGAHHSADNSAASTDSTTSVAIESTSLAQEHPKLLQVFHELDQSCSGTVSTDDLQQTLAAAMPQDMPAEVAEHAAEALVEIADINDTGDIQFDEFAAQFGHVKNPSAGKVLAYGLQRAAKAGLLEVPLTELAGGTHALRYKADTVAGALADVTIQGATDELHLNASSSAAALFSAGAAGGLLSRTLTAPLDRIRLTKQAGARADWVQLLQWVKSKAGWRAMWRGNLANCLKATPFAGVVCAVYVSCLSKVTSGERQPSSTERFAAGALAGAAAGLVTAPLDVVRTRLAVIRSQSIPRVKDLPPRHTTIVGTMRSIAAHEGMRGFWRGAGPGVLWAALFTGTMQWSFDTFIQTAISPASASLVPLPVRWATQDVSLTMLAACSAAVLAHTATHPLETVRRRMQLAPPGAPRAQAWGAVRDLVAREGARGIWAGLSTTLLKVVPAAAISLGVRDLTLGRTAHTWATVHRDARAFARGFGCSSSR